MPRLLLIAALVAFGCGGGHAKSRGPGDATGANTSADSRFESLARKLYQEHLDHRPDLAIRLGYHGYDGRVPDRSPAAIAAEVARLERAQLLLGAVVPGALSRRNQVDLGILDAEIRSELFSLRTLRRPQRDPLYYLLFGFSLEPYIDRDYAPLADRAKGLLAACKSAPSYYQQMLENLEPQLPKPALIVAGRMLKGTVKLVESSVRSAMTPLEDANVRQQIDRCLDELVTTLKRADEDLSARMPRATDDFALGEQLFTRMLADTQGFTTSLAKLKELGQQDLERNLDAIEIAARAIDPARPVREVVLEAADDKPDPDDVLRVASTQVERLRQFVIDHDIVSVPGNDVAEVRASPPHKRGNMASLSSAGPFETRDLPSFYYISPPDPTWPKAEQLAYVPSVSDLLFVSAHEVWPGHFLQGRHAKLTKSAIAQSFETYSTSEGWAHYAEELVWENGLGDGDPRVQIGLLKNALLRNVRFLVAIGLHTGGMSIEEATQLFRDKAFADPGTARQQAMRGTLDPMYLSYTLGKLAIRKLRRDYRQRRGDQYSAKSFHDELLAHAEAPLPFIRRMMLGQDAGPAL